MASLRLEVQKRQEVGKKVKGVRMQGKVPAVLYGHDVESQPVTLDGSSFEKVYRAAGESTLVDLVVDGGQAVKVLIQDVQHDPVTNDVIHTDLYQVNMNEKVTADVPLKFINDAPAVKDIGAILVTQLDSVEIECLPSDLIHDIEVDLSSLKAFDDIIHVSDLKVPEKIRITNHPEDVVAMVQEPRKEEEAVVAPAEAVMPERVGEEKSAEGDTEAPQGSEEKKDKKE